MKTKAVRRCSMLPHALSLARYPREMDPYRSALGASGSFRDLFFSQSEESPMAGCVG